MTKKKNDLDNIDDWSGFDDFDFDMSGFEGQDIADDRTPVSRIMGSFKSGVKNQAYDRNFQKQLLKRALPQKYESGFDVYENVTGFFRDLASDIKREINPGLKEVADLTKKAFPGKPAYVPESLYKKLTSLGQDDYEYPKVSQQQADSDRVSIMLGEVFQSQAQQEEIKDRQGAVREQLKAATGKKRFEVSHMAQMRTNNLLTTMVNYQDKVTTSYRKRILELTYKSYITQTRLLEVTKQNSEKSIKLLEGIAKNTGLPDFVKLRTTEAAKEILRRNMINSLAGGAQARIGGLMNRMMGNASKNVVALASQFGQAMQMAASVGGMMSGDDENLSIEERMIRNAEMGGDMAGSLLGARYMGKGADAVRRWIERGGENSLRRKIVKGGDYVNYYAGNVDQHLQNRIAGGGKGGFLDALFDFMGGQDEIYKNDSSLTRMQYGMDAIGGPGGNQSTRLTIEEVIPGWLNKIWGEIRMFRTGEDSYETQVFDFKSRNFKSVSGAAAGIAAAMFDKNKSNDDSMHAYAEKTAKQMIGSANVPREAFNALVKRIKLDALNGISPSFEKYRFDVGVPISESAQDALKKAIEETLGFDWEKNKFSTDHEHIQRRQSIMTGYKNVESRLNRARNDAIKFMDEGHLATLRHMGLVKETPQGLDFDYERYMDLQRNGVDLSGFDIPPPSGGGGGAPRRPAPTGPASGPTAAQMNASMQHGQDTQNYRSDDGDILFTEMQRGNELLEEQKEYIKAILARLNLGVATTGTATNSEQAEASMGKFLGITDLNTLPGRGVKAAWKVISGIRSTAGRFFNVGNVVKAAGAALSAGRFALDAGMAHVGNPLKEKLTKLTSVFVGNEKMPRLTFEGLRAGEYYDAASDKVIKTLADIKGAVKDKTGKIIISEEEFRAGLKDRYGRAISQLGGALGRMRNRIGDAASGLFGTMSDIVTSDEAKRAGKGAIGAAHRGGSAAIDFANRLFGGVPGMLAGGADKVKDLIGGGLGLGFGSNKTLKQIYKLLDERLPGKKKILGDQDGDGDRDNGWRDRIQNRKKKKEAARMSALERLKGKGKFGAGLAGLAGLLGLGKKKGGKGGDDDEESEGGGFGMTDMLLGASLGGTLAKGAWGLTKGTAKAAGTVARFGGKATWGAARIGGQVAMAGARMALPLLMNPVGLAILAVGAVGYLAYKAYSKNKAFEKSYMIQLRMMHYGIDYDEDDHVSRMIALEELMAKRFVMPGAENPFRDLSRDIPAQDELLNILGVTRDDTAALGAAIEWFSVRVGPVMAKWFNVANAVKDVRDLKGIDEWHPSDKMSMLAQLNFPVDDERSPVNFPFNGILGQHGEEAPVGKDISDFYKKVFEQCKEDKEKAQSDAKKKAKEIESGIAYKETKRGRRVDYEATAKLKAAKQEAEAERDRIKKLQENAGTGVLLPGSLPKKDKKADIDVLGIMAGTMAAAQQAGNEWRFPLAPGAGKVTSLASNSRKHPVTGSTRPHKGVDIGAPEGTPVYAAAAGKVVLRRNLTGYGQVIFIEHENGKVTRYAHLSGYADGIEEGVHVGAGQLIGYVGNTGVGTGPHLHFEIRDGMSKSSGYVDPLAYLNDATTVMYRRGIEEYKNMVRATPEGYEGKPEDNAEGMSTLTSDLGVKQPKMLEKDIPIMLRQQHAQQQQAAAAARPAGTQPRTSASGEPNYAKQQVDGISAVGAGVNNMVKENQAGNDILRGIHDALAPSGPTFVHAGMTPEQQVASNVAANEQATRPAAPAAPRRRGQGGRVRTMSTTSRTSPSGRSL